MNNKLRILIFNEDNHLLCASDGLIYVEYDNYHKTWDEEVFRKIREKYAIEIGVGDVVYQDDVAGSACLGFVDVLSPPPDGFEYRSMAKAAGDDFDIQVFAGLQHGLMNPYTMRQGYCYMNQATDECYHVITTIAASDSGAKLHVLECNLSTLPMVLPAEMFLDLPMKWISHAKYVRMTTEIATIDILNPPISARRAQRFFIKAHNNTLHFYDGKPYSMHLSKVVFYFRKYKHLIPEKDHALVEACLWGHDSIEDARLTYNNVKEVLGEAVADGAYVMSNEKGKTRNQRANDKYYKELCEHTYGEFMKLCDRLANMSNSVETGHSMASGYSKEMKKFEERLRSDDTYKEMWDELHELKHETA